MGEDARGSRYRSREPRGNGFADTVARNRVVVEEESLGAGKAPRLTTKFEVGAVPRGCRNWGGMVKALGNRMLKV